MKRQPITITIGTRFNYTHADSNPLWEVKSSRGRGTWNCEVVESEDWLGTKKVFGNEEIARSIGMKNLWAKLGDESDSYYQSLSVGQIVHYQNGFDNYVRCEVTADKQLLPIALVGAWSSHDLPQRRRNGEISLPYYPKKIKESEPFKTPASNIWECSQRGKDPRRMPAISLEVSPMTEDKETLAAEYRKLDAIREYLNDNDLTPAKAFAQLRAMLEGK